jgi:hypothetical protein
MITKDTPAQIVELTDALYNASEALERIFQELSRESNAQLAAAAALFVERKKQQSGFEPYLDARQELIRAAGAASDIDELVGQTVTIKGRCSFLTHIALKRATKKGKIQSVCEKAGSSSM